MKTGKADLPRHHRMFRLVFFSNSFNGAKMESIERKTKLLAHYFFGSEYSFGTYKEKQEMLMRTKERIIRELFFNYLEREHYLKYDSKYSLSTWVVTIYIKTLII